MRTARPQPAVVALIAAGLAVVGVAACSLTSLEGYAGSPEEDAGAPDTSVPPIDAAPDAAVVFASCDALKKAKPATPDGMQLIDPDGPGPLAPFSAYCDMTKDDGGWMLLTGAMLGAESPQAVTVVRGVAEHDGVVLRVYANGQACGARTPSARHRVILPDLPAWSRVRSKQTFAGKATCWVVFGGHEDGSEPFDANVLPFDKTKDVIRDEVRMGGSLGDAFAGRTSRCDASPENFWGGIGQPRSATVILRRSDLVAPSGLATGADCGDFGPGMSSPTYWEYRDIYVK